MPPSRPQHRRLCLGSGLAILAVFVGAGCGHDETRVAGPTAEAPDAGGLPDPKGSEPPASQPNTAETKPTPPLPDLGGHPYLPPEQHGKAWEYDPFLSAIAGDIYSDRLLLGLEQLESSPLALSPAQAQAALDAVHMMQAKLLANEHYDQQLLQVLSPAQLKKLEARAAALTQEGLHEKVTPLYMAQVAERLATLAGMPQPPVPPKVPADIVPQPRPYTVSAMTLFMMELDTWQHDRALAMDADQARRLLPWLSAYVHLKNQPSQGKHDILAELSHEQKAYIDANTTSRVQGFQEMTALLSRVEALLQARVAP